jgi:hypothetical protein
MAHEKHGAKVRALPVAGAEQAGPSWPTTQRLTDEQRVAGETASRIVRRAADGSIGLAGVARKLSKSGDVVESWARESDPAQMSLRDVLTVGGDFGRLVTAQMETAMDANRLVAPARSPECHATPLLARLADLAEHLEAAMQDRALSPEEHTQALAKIERLEGQLAQLRRDLHAAGKR